MAIISRLRQLIGLDGDGPDAGGTRVPVEREPAAESERAVKEPVSSDDDDDGSPPPAPTGAGAEDGADAPGAEPVDSLSGIGPTYAELLTEAGVETVADLASADAADLDAETGIGVGRLSGWIERASDR